MLCREMGRGGVHSGPQRRALKGVEGGRPRRITTFIFMNIVAIPT